MRYYYKIMLPNGEVEERPFTEVHHDIFGESFASYIDVHRVALHLVNDWNRQAHLNPPQTRFLYWVEQ